MNIWWPFSTPTNQSRCHGNSLTMTCYARRDVGKKAITALHHNIIRINAHNKQKLWGGTSILPLPLWWDLPPRYSPESSPINDTTAAGWCVYGTEERERERERERDREVVTDWASRAAVGSDDVALMLLHCHHHQRRPQHCCPAVIATTTTTTTTTTTYWWLLTQLHQQQQLQQSFHGHFLVSVAQSW